MHMLSDRHYEEFIRSPTLIRATLARGSEESVEPTLLIKADSLPLKYLILSTSITLCINRNSDGSLIYGTEIPDDPEDPGLVWSLAATTDEIEALTAALRERVLHVFLFNELTVNVAYSRTALSSTEPDAQRLLAEPIAFVLPTAHEEIEHRNDIFPTRAEFLDIIGMIDVPWQEMQSYYIQRNLRVGLVSLFDSDEGGQQEHIATWISDSLAADVTVRSPVLASSGKELTDLLVSYSGGDFLLESKALAILGRSQLPSRDTLRSAIEKHLDKATRQLRGALRSLRNGAPVVDHAGQSVQLASTSTPHTIVLVPDLSLLHSSLDYGADFFRQTTEHLAAYFHILDMAELVRTVQGAIMLAQTHPEQPSRIEAFDYLLIKRAWRSATAQTPHFEILYRAGLQPE